MVNICITGALGHIGSALIRDINFLGLGRVYLVDNFLTQRYSSLFNLPDNIDYHFIDCDIDSKKMVEVINDCQYLVHLAAITNAEQSFDRQHEIEQVNINGLENIAKICADSGCALIFPSSTSVYGVQEGLVDEDCPEEFLKPQSPYADSKIAGERLLEKLGIEKNLKFVILRVGTIFGYSIGMRFHTAVNKFIWQACMGIPLTVWKTAMYQNRPYCGVNDAANAFKFFITENLINNQTYNILTDNYSVNEVVNKIKEEIPNLSINYVDSKIMNQLSYNVSNKKIINKGFIFKDLLSDSIKKSISILKNANPNFLAK